MGHDFVDFMSLALKAKKHARRSQARQTWPSPGP